MKYYKTVITVEVLSDEPFMYNNLEEVAYQIYFGHASGYTSDNGGVEITEEQLVNECAKHGTDPTFFTEIAAELAEGQND